jgi:hypothetical protein
MGGFIMDRYDIYADVDYSGCNGECDDCEFLDCIGNENYDENDYYDEGEDYSDIWGWNW